MAQNVDLVKGHAFRDYWGDKCRAKLIDRGERLELGRKTEGTMKLTKDMARALALLLLNWAVEDTLET